MLKKVDVSQMKIEVEGNSIRQSLNIISGMRLNLKNIKADMEG